MTPDEMIEKELANKTLAIGGALPLIGGIVTVAGAYAEIVGIQKRHRLFHRLQWFFQDYENIPLSEKDKFERELKDEKSSFYRDLLIVIDDLDSDRQVKMTLKLFRLLLNGKIEMIYYKRLTNIIRKFYLDDLDFLYRFKDMTEAKAKDMGQDTELHLISLQTFGLVNEVMNIMPKHDNIRISSDETVYSITRLGRNLLDLCYVP